MAAILPRRATAVDAREIEADHDVCSRAGFDPKPPSGATFGVSAIVRQIATDQSSTGELKQKLTCLTTEPLNRRKGT